MLLRQRAAFDPKTFLVLPPPVVSIFFDESCITVLPPNFRSVDINADLRLEAAAMTAAAALLNYGCYRLTGRSTLE